MTFSGRFVLNLIHFAGAQGVELNNLIPLTGHSQPELQDEELRLDAEVYNTIVEEIIFRTKDPYFGLHSGEQLNLSTAGLVAQITQTSRTVLEAMKYFCEFAMLGCRAIPMEMTMERDVYKLALVADPLWHRQSPLATRQTIEGMLTFLIRAFNNLTLQQNYPLKIHFNWSRPEDTSEYQRVFKCPMEFDQHETAMFFESETVDQPTITANYELLGLLVTHAREKVEDITQARPFSQTVRFSILNMLDPDFPTIEAVAANLNLSVRTFQRKLKEEGFTYKALLEELKKEFARIYLRDAKLQISDVASLLNYSDTSAFTRSFKRWTGKTPLEFKQAL